MFYLTIAKILKNLNYRAFLYLLFLCKISFIHPATISGKVVDKKSKDPLIGANIFLEEDDRILGGSATDVDGLYTIENISSEGFFNLKASYLGYKPFSLEIEIDDVDSRYEFNLELDPSSIKVDEIIVKDEKRKEKKTEAPASKEIISSRDIRRSTTTNLGGYLKGLKGVDFTSSGINNFSLSVRGFNSSSSTRLLMLTDGRVANLPALRVINFSTIPQSSEDVDKIEVVLGPATALYGANAHSGVINIISKPPSTSEGFNASFSGTNDERQLQKFATRYAKKYGNISFKISGEYVHANEWPYISELEYKLHRYPWSGHPERMVDGKDNNPWEGIPASGGIPEYGNTALNNYGVEVLVGNGEANHGDLDGDGVAGEDWYNGFDDDGDSIDTDGDGYCNGQEMQFGSNWNDISDYPSEAIQNFSNWIDEDYFYADGVDNQEPFTDTNGNTEYDDGESFIDWNGDGVWTGPNWVDYNNNGVPDKGDIGIDESIDSSYDTWYDGIDNNGDGAIDENQEVRTDPSSPTGNWALALDDGILVFDGRKQKNIESNPLYDPEDWENFDSNDNGIIEESEGDCFSCKYIGSDDHIRGDMRYNEDKFKLEFDMFIYDFGDDEVAGDPFEDLSGNDGVYNVGESYNASFGSFNDNGLDGIPGTGDAGEGDGTWQPGDGWVDTNNNGVVDYGIDTHLSCYDNNDDGTCWLGDTFYTQDDFPDVWPPGDGVWQNGEIIHDCGQDGYCFSDVDVNTCGANGCIAVDIYGNTAVDSDGNPVYISGPDFGENDGLLVAIDLNEQDGIMDTGDGLYAAPGVDVGNDGSYLDVLDGDTPPDYIENFEITNDVNGDGIPDYPDFEVENKKAEFRIDYDPSPDLNLTFQTGYSWTKTQQVSAIGRFMAEGWESTFYQLRGRYYDWFAQAFFSQSNSGQTRNYNIGQVLDDQSTNLGLQLQNDFFMPRINTEVTWGADYAKTMPKTFGSILNDGPNGYDDDGDNALLQSDGIDNNGDGVIDDEFDGTDEPDEYSEVVSNEYGLYFQSKTDVLGNNEWEFIAAARLDYQDQLNEGLQFGPKVGINYSPSEKSTWRLTYGLAYNTPTITTLYTDLYYGKNGIFDVFLKGNKDGTPYSRVPNDEGNYTAGGSNYSFNLNPLGPGYYNEEGVYIKIPQYEDVFQQILTEDGTVDYEDRVTGAPFFFNISDLGPNDYIPLDTARHYIYVPYAADDGGTTYTPQESFNLPDVDPLGPEKMQTVEFGYKGFIGKKTFIAADLYISQYDDFFSPATIITPLVKRISDDSTVGMMPVNAAGSNPPYGTAWNGLDDDDDWQGVFANYIANPYDENGNIVNTSGVDMYWSEAFGWHLNDLNGDCVGTGAVIGDGHPCWQDPGEWGYIEYVFEENQWDNILGYTIYRPEDVLTEDFTFLLSYQNSENDRKSNIFWDDVGVDEYGVTSGLNEAEQIPLGILGSDGEERYGIGRPTAPPNIVLSSLNYGNIVHSGIDVALTHFISKKLIFDSNFAFFNSTDYYNTLTKRFDPINAPKFKFNASLKWDTNENTDLMLTYRHVQRFEWRDGIWEGFVGPYDIIDLHFNRKITDNLKFSVSALNVFDDQHREMIGGAKIGRQIILKMTSSF